MRVEGGSQNLFRTPGQYAYPAPRYNQNAIEGVGAVRGGNHNALKRLNTYPYTNHAAAVPSRQFLQAQSSARAAMNQAEGKGASVDLLA